jgi:3-isopropylmalate/(R)-2-methylmalate dehydratase large subunit
MDSRLTICNMAIEAGAKNGIFAVDDITREYVNGRFQREAVEYFSDEDAEYVSEIVVDLSTLKPQVAFPHLPSNTKEIGTFGEVKIDQVVIGSCTNGRIEDMQAAAKILKGKKVAPYLRLIVIPGTPDVYRQCMKEGLIDIFMEAGGVVSTPTCGPCLGGYMGILAKGERALATTNRNFIGRMGDPESEVYLCNPIIAAASAITGRICTPEEAE